MSTTMVEKRVGGIKLVGFSLAGEETVVAAPELNVCFDVGRAPREIISVDTVCLSHGHMDHAAGIAYYFSQRNFLGNVAGTVLAPMALVKPLRDLVRVWGQIEGHVSPARIVGLEPGQDHRIRRDLVVRAFSTNHATPALGFCVIETRKKLKSEYASLNGPQLVELKKQGIQIDQENEVPLVCYAGDTMDGPHFDLDFVRRSQVLLLECTFFEPDHVQRAREGRHLHVRDLAALARRLENPDIVLVHVTRRTGMRLAYRYLREVIGTSGMERFTFLMDRPRPPAGEPSEPAVEDAGSAAE
jgi:ribonuclease Z